ncbi:MAG: hypothetical protein KF688_02715 [Pirellulales bacterium]|nr:hypothetical protein [Pirellulales bacterium]
MAAKEVWVSSNRRVLGFAMAPPAALAATGVGIVAAADGPLTQTIGWAFAGIGAIMLAGLAAQYIRPRVAYRDGLVLFYLRPGAPIEVPVAAIEAFFLGQGPAHLPGNRGERLESTNLVARISQKFPEWEHVLVKPALGRWCEHYVTISGPWCEQLDGELIRRLNRRLREIHDAARQAAPAGAAS